MELPEELVERIAETCVIAGGLKEWCRSWRGTCRRFASREWFEDVVRGGIPMAVVPSVRCPTVQLGVSRARPATDDAIERALSTRRALSRIAGKSTQTTTTTRTKSWVPGRWFCSPPAYIPRMFA